MFNLYSIALSNFYLLSRTFCKHTHNCSKPVPIKIAIHLFYCACVTTQIYQNRKKGRRIVYMTCLKAPDFIYFLTYCPVHSNRLPTSNQRQLTSWNDNLV